MNNMKNSCTILILLVFSIIGLASCEKDDPNPFIGTWENFIITARGSSATTLVFRSNMTVTFTMVVTIDGEDTIGSTDYNYSYTTTTLTIWEDGEEEETTEYMINDTYLILSPGTDFEVTLTKAN